MLKGTAVTLKADFSKETMKSRRRWNDSFKKLKENNCQF
jgi:hypothetical protein